MNFLQKNYVKYGLLMCGVIVLCFLYMELTGQNKSFDKPPLVSAAFFFAPVLIWYLGINAKKKLLKGKMTFMQGFIEGVKMSLVYAIIGPLICGIYYQINPAIIQSLRKAYLFTTASDTTIIHVDMLITFATSLIMGTILSAITAFFLKSKKK